MKVLKFHVRHFQFTVNYHAGGRFMGNQVVVETSGLLKRNKARQRLPSVPQDGRIR